MAEKEIDLRRLVIKAFHMTDVEWGEHNNITTDGHMTVSKEMIDQLVAQDDCIEKIDIQIIKPGDHDRWTNTIMDIIPISTKVLGKLGEGITHTITGVYVMLTGVDVNGKQCHEFGSSEGNLKETSFDDFFFPRKCINNSFSIQRAAYVASLALFSGSNVTTAFMSPIVPIDRRSSISSGGG